MEQTTTKNHDIKLSEVFTIARAVEFSGFPMRTLYRRIKTGKITPIIFANKFLLDKETVHQLKREVLSA